MPAPAVTSRSIVEHRTPAWDCRRSRFDAVVGGSHPARELADLAAGGLADRIAGGLADPEGDR
jgi:hypothetical protein